MRAHLTNLKPGSQIAAGWQSHKPEPGRLNYLIPAGHWIHEEGNETTTTRGMPQKFGYYRIVVSLAGYQAFEYIWPVTEEQEEIKVRYKKEKTNTI